MMACFYRALGRPLPLAAYWGYRVCGAALLALPLIGVGTSVGVDHAAGGDSVLFEPGGLFLLEALRLALPQARAQAWQAGVGLLALSYFGLVPLAGLLLALRSDTADGTNSVLRAAWAKLPAFSVLLGLVLAAQGLLVILALLLAPGVLALLERFLGVPAIDLVALGLCALVALALAGCGAVHDLARAHVVATELRGPRALYAAITVARRNFWTLAASWLALLAISALLVGGAAALTAALAVERAETWRWLTAFGVHQSVIVVLVLLRATWLARVMTLTEKVRDSGDVGARPYANDHA